MPAESGKPRRHALTGGSPESSRPGKAPPVGSEHLSESAEETPDTPDGAAESAAADPELAILVKRWASLNAHTKATIIGIVKALKGPEAG